MQAKMKRENLIGLSLEELAGFIESLGHPTYRARQVLQWIYQKRVFSFSEMTNLPETLRELLSEQAIISLPEVVVSQSSADGTRKFLFSLGDKETVEAVLIPEGSRLTACISSQVGCAVGCSFCATGQGGLIRNLSAGEIVGQILVLLTQQTEDLSNVVFMGMGEPFANYDQVMGAVRLMNHPEGLGMGARRLTISTSGVVPGILRLAREGLQVNLAVSLHASTNDLRNQLVPINKAYPIEKLLEACQFYVAETGRRITFEYVLLDGVNDSEADAHRLGELLAGMLCHVNLIPVNPISVDGYVRPKQQETKKFARIVTEYGVEATIRQEKGTDIDAACGQLRKRQT